MNEAMNTHGAFSWNELMTTDLAAAKDFYGELLGWSIEEMQTESMGPYAMAKVDGKEVAGMMATPPGAADMPAAWGAYVTVDDVDAMVARVKDLGGTICVAPTDIPKVGRFTLIQDPQGAMLALITYTDEAKNSAM